MYEVQHQNKFLWESNPSWNLIARRSTLADAVVAIGRIFQGDNPGQRDDYRIVKYTAKGKTRAMYDSYGNLVVDTGLAIVVKRRTIKTAKLVTA